MKQIILGIETSCDETAAAVYDSDDGMKSNVIFSQISLHQQFGGVIPEIASRAHLEKIGPIVNQALADAGVSLDQITTIAVTNKPGLAGSLLVGVCFAKSLSFAKNIPLIGVNHLEGHVFSALIDNDVPFPHICLTASGGHTSMYLVEDFGVYKTIATTRDDAAGEAFDKIAKLVHLGYPGGPIIEKLAEQAGFVDYFHYPRAGHSILDFSFSGLKTAVIYDLVDRGLYSMEKKQLIDDSDQELKKQIASSLLVAIADIFIEKLEQALKIYPKVKAVTFVGGVACNKYIRNRISERLARSGLPLFYPKPAYCTDNGAMIAFVGNYKARKGQFDTLELDILT